MHPEDILRLKETAANVNKLQALENEQTTLLKEVDRLLKIKLLTPSQDNISLLKNIVNQVKK